MELGLKLLESDGETLADLVSYRKFIGKLIYLTNTRPNLSFLMNNLSQYLGVPRDKHIIVQLQILQYIKRALGLFPTN